MESHSLSIGHIEGKACREEFIKQEARKKVPINERLREQGAHQTRSMQNLVREIGTLTINEANQETNLLQDQEKAMEVTIKRLKEEEDEELQEEIRHRRLKRDAAMRT